MKFKKRDNIGKLALIGLAALFVISIINIGIYFLLYVLLFSFSNIILCTTLDVVQLSIFASLSTFIIKIIFFNKRGD